MTPRDRFLAGVLWESTVGQRWSCDFQGAQPQGRLFQQEITPMLATTATMAYIAKSFYDLKATDLEGEVVDFNNFRGRVVLIENVASL